jgi:hypothetical protein
MDDETKKLIGAAYADGALAGRRAALTEVADELAGFKPVPSLFRARQNNAVSAAKATLRFALDLLRERAAGLPDTSRPATPEELAEVGAEIDAENEETNGDAGKD